MKKLISGIAVILGVPFFLVFYFFALITFTKRCYELFSL